MNKAAIFLFLILSLGASAQKQVTTSEQTWLGFIQQVRLNNRWGLTADVHYRTATGWVQGRNLALGRVGAVYFLNDRTQLAAGYAHFYYYPGENHPLAARPEHRLWQQVQWATNGPRLRVQNRIRLEQRWRGHINGRGGVDDHYDFNWRARTQLQLLYPLGKRPFTPGTVALMLADELMLNFGKEIVFNSFDQNRVIAGVQLQVGKRDVLQAGYMHIFQQQASGVRYRQSHVARIFYTHNLDFRETKK